MRFNHLNLKERAVIALAVGAGFSGIASWAQSGQESTPVNAGQTAADTTPQYEAAPDHSGTDERTKLVLTLSIGAVGAAAAFGALGAESPTGRRQTEAA